MENNLLEIFNELNPEKGIEHLDYIRFTGVGKKKEIFIPLWLSKILNCESSWYNGKYVSRILRQNNINVQIFYDSVILGLKDINHRPTCPICGSTLKFRTISHGYESTCSKDCHSKLKRISYDNTVEMKKKGDKVSELVKQKISKSLKGRPISEEARRKRSEYMKAFAKTEKGKEFYKRVGEINAKSNREILNGEKIINTPTGYYVSSRFKRGKVFVETFNKMFTYDSSWELLFIEYFMDENNISDVLVFDRCKQEIPYVDQEGKPRNYSPDFYIKFVSGIRLVIEIKPKFLLSSDEKVKLKIKAGEEFFKDKNIKYLVFTEDVFLEKSLGKMKIKTNFNINDFNN